MAPLPGEMSQFEAAREKETFEEAVERVTSTISAIDVGVSDAHDDPEALLRTRIHLNVEELAAVEAVHARTLRRWLDGTRRGPLSPGLYDRLSIVLGERRRFFRITLMPESWWNGLSISQRELVEQLLRVPMGSTQFGGPAEPELSLNAVSL